MLCVILRVSFRESWGQFLRYSYTVKIMYSLFCIIFEALVFRDIDIACR